MPPIDQLVPYFQVYGPVAVTIGVAIAAWAVFQNIAINQRNKRADCIFHCNNRYDEIYKYKSSIVDKHALRQASDAKAKAALQAEEHTIKPGEEPDETRHYYARYWGLKSDEFDYWLAKLIDLDTIMNWSFLTLEAFKENPAITSAGVTTTFRQGWVSIGLPDNDISNPWFTEFTTMLLRLGKSQLSNRVVEHSILIDLFECMEKEAKSYRRTLQHEMTVKSYRETRRKKERLTLAAALEKSARKHGVVISESVEA